MGHTPCFFPFLCMFYGSRSHEEMADYYVDKQAKLKLSGCVMLFLCRGVKHTVVIKCYVPVEMALAVPLNRNSCVYVVSNRAHPSAVDPEHSITPYHQQINFAVLHGTLPGVCACVYNMSKYSQSKYFLILDS